MEKQKQIPIWFFIGALVGVYGLIILATGITRYVNPPEAQMALANLHADIWWGLLLTAIGALYTGMYWPWRRRKLN